jgi:hypothetical protein
VPRKIELCNTLIVEQLVLHLLDDPIGHLARVTTPNLTEEQGTVARETASVSLKSLQCRCERTPACR